MPLLVFDNGAAVQLPEWDDPFYVMPIRPVTARSAGPWDFNRRLPTGEFARIGTKIIADDTGTDLDCMATDEFLDLYERIGSDHFRPKPALWPMILLSKPFHLFAPSDRIGHHGWRVTQPFTHAGRTGYPMLKRSNDTCQNAHGINNDDFAIMAIPRRCLF